MVQLEEFSLQKGCWFVPCAVLNKQRSKPVYQVSVKYTLLPSMELNRHAGNTAMYDRSGELGGQFETWIEL